MKKYFPIVLCLFTCITVKAQVHVATEKEIIKGQINNLAAPAMHGRGYVMNGRDDAAKYLQNKFKEFNLRSFTKAHNYLQGYNFPVNTFPGAMSLKLNKQELTPGADYIIDASSPSFSGEKLKGENVDLVSLLKYADSTGVEDSAYTDSAWQAMRMTFDTEHIYYLQHVDSFCKVMHYKVRNFPSMLPKGCFILSAKNKLTWDVSGDTIAATVFYVLDESIPTHIKSGSVNVKSLFVPKAHNDNIIGCVPGAVKDTFIAITAHYDHLGMMGDTTIFPGASDNASGTAMMLYLASYFSQHPQHYSMLFIAFSGEEIGLLGSAYYVTHPIVPVKNIHFLINLDIMGDATDGITAVNATEYPKEFDLLQKINTTHDYIPVIKSRGKAANSDHYFFTEKGVPSFFLYSNGGKGYYHDIFDTAHAVTLNHIDGVASLLIDFVKELK
jgi:hypothetical protein